MYFLNLSSNADHNIEATGVLYRHFERENFTLLKKHYSVLT